MGLTQFQQALIDQKLLFLDTMVFVYLLDNHANYAKLSIAVLEVIEQGTVRGVTTTLTLGEILTQPARKGDIQAMQDYELYLTNFPNLTLHPLDTAIARQAAQVRAATGLKMPDAIQLATAQSVAATAIISNDKQWQGKTGNIKLFLLDDYL